MRANEIPFLLFSHPRTDLSNHAFVRLKGSLLLLNVVYSFTVIFDLYAFIDIDVVCCWVVRWVHKEEKKGIESIFSSFSFIIVVVVCLVGCCGDNTLFFCHLVCSPFRGIFFHPLVISMASRKRERGAWPMVGCVCMCFVSYVLFVGVLCNCMQL